MHQEYVTLRNGIKMPRIGFGVFKVSDPEECYTAVKTALAVGYRHIDTAAFYMNEEAVGRAIRDSGIPREEIFVTSKLWVNQSSYEGAFKAYQQSLDKLGLEYLDLFLIHQPWGDYHGAWRALTELYKAGKVRAIGVSNLYPERFVDFMYVAEIPPFVSQVEIHPFNHNAESIALCKEYDVVVEAWSPFAQGTNGIFTNSVLQIIANKHQRSVSQVILRWILQLGAVPLPKSVHENRMRQNLDVWDFELDAEDMEQIATLDQGLRMTDHRTVATVRRHYNTTC